MLSKTIPIWKCWVLIGQRPSSAYQEETALSWQVPVKLSRKQPGRIYNQAELTITFTNATCSTAALRQLYIQTAAPQDRGKSRTPAPLCRHMGNCSRR